MTISYVGNGRTDTDVVEPSVVEQTYDCLLETQ